MIQISKLVSEATEGEYQDIKRSKEPRGIFTNSIGKLYSILNNMEGKVEESNYYSKEKANKAVHELRVKYSAQIYEKVAKRVNASR